MKFLLQSSLQASIIFLCGFLASHSVFAGCQAPNADVVSNNPDSVYTVNNDSTVIDNNTGLMWQQCSLGLSGSACEIGSITTFTWNQALAAANSNTASGYSDWRLPNKNELASLVDYSCRFRPINDTVFPASTASAYWSSTPYAGNDEIIWISDYSNGGSMNAANGTKNRAGILAVRLVRGLE